LRLSLSIRSAAVASTLAGSQDWWQRDEMNDEERRELVTRLTEDITSTIYALHADPDEAPSPLTLGATLAEVAIRAIESAGFEIGKRPLSR
jgi:hypothetical protein